MGDATVVGSKWRLVELGRVVLLQGNGPYAGRLATIVEIIDHKRVGSPVLCAQSLGMGGKAARGLCFLTGRGRAKGRLE